MRIIQVNKFNYLRGGAEKYFLEMTQALRSSGHEVAIFSMQHPKNLPSEWASYFVSRVSYNEGSFFNRLKGIGRMLYSFEAKRKFEQLVTDFKPDIIHIHNIYHQISPSILDVARQHNIPVVMHLHDYKLISANYQLFCGGHICYDGTAPHYFKCFWNKCFKDSYLASFLVSLEMFFHHRILKIYEKSVSLYIAPSNFMKDTCVRFGVPEKKIKVMYNFITHEVLEPQTNLLPYILYLGRLSEEKGIDVLLRSVALNSKTKLKIAGNGPAQRNLLKITSDLKISNQVEFLGHLEQKKLGPIIELAQAIVIPSIWLENMPFALLEAMALGKVVIVSKIGGLAELIENNVNGFSFEAGNAQALAHVITNLAHYDLEQISKSALARVTNLKIENHRIELLHVYEQILS